MNAKPSMKLFTPKRKEQLMNGNGKVLTQIEQPTSQQVQNPKVLIVNTDVRGSGINNLAPKEKIKEVFSFPPITVKTWIGITDLFEKLGSVQDSVIVEKIGDQTIQIPESKFIFNPPYDQLDAIVFDTADGIYWAAKTHLLGDALSMNQHLWDKMTNIMVPLFEKIGYMPIPVIVNVHEKVEEKGEYKTIQPFLQGTIKTQIGNFFDVIAFTKVYRGPRGVAEFKFQLIPDRIRECRTTEKLFAFAQKCGGEIKQDYTKLFAHIGIPNPKILIIGTYGSGKTTSLKTLQHIQFNK
jgi:hypothetical protein